MLEPESEDDSLCVCWRTPASVHLPGSYLLSQKKTFGLIQQV